MRCARRSSVRKFRYTARQAAQEWGEDAGKDVLRAAEKEPDRPFAFLHAVMPRADRDPERPGAKGKPILSAYVNLEERTLVAEGGYDELPYQVPRWSIPAFALWHAHFADGVGACRSAGP
jgi:hypothetical protein